MHFVLIVTRTSSETASRVVVCDTLDYAKSVFHGELAYRQEDRLYTMCTITDAEGHQIKSEVYHKDGNTA